MQADTHAAAPFVVALGASADGLDALERFFAHVPPRTGMAFVVIQHLSAEFDSHMADILSRRTKLPVRVATHGARLEPDTVYLNPPKHVMTLDHGRLQLADRAPGPAVPNSIDRFLQSLAIDAAGRCAAIVLSGAGSDGSRGIIDVHGAGGLVIVQTPATAGFDGMPLAAIDTGHADLMLAPEDMPEALRAYLADGGVEPQPETATHSGLARLISLLSDAYGIDFFEYKLPTIARRTERRMKAAGVTDLDAYLARLASDRAELDALYHDLLIGVTQFFRDREAFAELAKLLPEQLRALGPEEEFRVWVVACASGEEAYSIAILVREALDALGLANPVKIFATDIHREALRVAGAGIYGEASLALISPERRQRWFTSKGGRKYQIAPAIRSMLVFAPHNVLQDVPFNRLDAISCRNLLMYLRPAAQRRVLDRFCYALKPRGIAFLGSSEPLSELGSSFQILDAHWKIVRKQSSGPRAAHRPRLAATAPTPPRLGGAAAVTRLEPNLFGTYDALLDALVPPSILVDARGHLVQTFAGASRFLRVPDGPATWSAIDLLGDDLRIAVTGGLERVFADHAPVHYRRLRAELGGQVELVNVTVREIVNRRTGDLHALITFEPDSTAARPADLSPAVPSDQLARDQVAALERALRTVKENLQATTEALETSNEELQATNEELVASNEELKSTNEELHSVNHELEDVNRQLQRKIDELTQLATDMDLLVGSTEVHTLFLDKELRIRRFTPLIAEVFHLVPSDLGRRIDGFNHALRAPAIYAEAQQVLATGRPFEHQVRGAGDTWYLLRILPCRRGVVTEGAVLTLVDITNLKRFELEAQNRRDQLSSILANSPDPVWIRDRDGRYVVADDSFRKLTGRDPTGLRPEQVFSADVAAMLTRDDTRVLDHGATVQAEETIPTPSGPRTFLSVKFPMTDAAGNRWGIGGIQTDVSALKRAEAEAREAADRRDHFLASLSHELRNPLAAILNAARVLGHGPLPAEDTATWHRIVLERAQHMVRLVDDLLDVARLTQNKLVLKRTQLDLGATTRGVVEEVDPEFRERGVALRVRADDPLIVFGDATRLHQLQVNLLTNAARHAPPGSEVSYTVRRADDSAEICVTDTGSGIAPEILGKIFELFVQGDRPGSRGGNGGLGVGLALVRRIAELHGGTAVASSPGVGRGAE
ncbi:MAG TPA: chemotaxis protein CheB, partial [Kofleriaceae bacterium]